MKIFLFSGGSSPILISSRIFIFSGVSLYYSITPQLGVTLHENLIGATLRWSRFYRCTAFYRKSTEDSVIWRWNFCEGTTKQVYTLPSDLSGDSWRFSGKHLVMLSKDSTGEYYSVVDFDTKVPSRINVKDRFIYTDDDLIVSSTTRKPKIVLAHKKTDEFKWEYVLGDVSGTSYSVDAELRLLMISYRETTSRQMFLDILDLSSGRLLLKKAVDKSQRDHLSVNGQLYFCDFQAVYRFDPKSSDLQLIYENSMGKTVGFSISSGYIALVCREPNRIIILSLDTGALIKEQYLGDFLVPETIEVSPDGVTAILFEEQEVEYLQGRNRIGILTIDELLNEEWVVEAEPEFFPIDEVEDVIWGGIALEISFAPGLTFDDLFRHAAISIHNRSYQYGWVGVGIYAEKGKEYDERFSGKIYLNLLNYALSERQKFSIDQLCNYLTEKLDVAWIRAGDRKTPITITSLMTASD